MMPLKEVENPLWHWTQAVAWIAFDRLDDPGRDLRAWGFSYYDDAARADASKAIEQLLDAVQAGKIKKKWKRSELPRNHRVYDDAIYTDDGRHDAERAMRNRVFGVLNMAGPHETVALYFEREAILAEWKGDIEAAERDRAERERGNAPLHWTRAVAWLAFQDFDAEKNDILALAYWQHFTRDSLEASRRFTRAIRTICDAAAAGEVSPIWGPRNGKWQDARIQQHAAFAANLEQTKTDLYECIYSEGWKSHSSLRLEYDRLSFHTTDIERLAAAGTEVVQEQFETTAAHKLAGETLSLGEIVNICRGVDPLTDFRTNELSEPWQTRYTDIRGRVQSGDIEAQAIGEKPKHARVTFRHLRAFASNQGDRWQWLREFCQRWETALGEEGTADPVEVESAPDQPEPEGHQKTEVKKGHGRGGNKPIPDGKALDLMEKLITNGEAKSVNEAAGLPMVQELAGGSSREPMTIKDRLWRKYRNSDRPQSQK